MSKHVGLYIYAGLAAAFALGSPVRVAADTLSSEGGEAVAIAASKDIESVAHGAFGAAGPRVCRYCGGPSACHARKNHLDSRRVNC